MEEKIISGYLYDFYGQLLNAHQREIYEAYAFDDLSLSEIAEQEGISRQGVYDIIRRCTRSLENYEQALHLVARFMKIKEDIERIQKLTEGDRVTENSLGEIRRISRGILEEL